MRERKLEQHSTFTQNKLKHSFTFTFGEDSMLSSAKAVISFGPMCRNWNTRQTQCNQSPQVSTALLQSYRLTSVPRRASTDVTVPVSCTFLC